MDNLPVKGRVLQVPRGIPGSAPLALEMDIIDEAERRLHEARLASHATKTELSGLFNEAANAAGKYSSWIAYEILRAKKHQAKCRSNVILGSMMDEAKRLKELGVKMNEDIREAFISKDPACEEALDILNSLIAVQTLLEEHKWSFIRSFNSVQEIAQSRGASPTPQFGGSLGQTYNIPQANFMGEDERKKNG